MSIVLLIGEDDTLLGTRAAVLRTTGTETVSTSAGGALGKLAERACDLVVLCHSLTAETCAGLTEAIQAGWPGTRILRVTSDRAWGWADADGEMNTVTSAEPERLVEKTRELLQRGDVGRRDGAGPAAVAG